jgi:hypothetical protein
VSAEESDAERAARVARENTQREEQLRRVPLQKIDMSKWPTNVRQIALAEAGGLGIDSDGRLYWNGKPVEIVGRRLDLTSAQAVVGLVVAFFTIVGATGAAVQGWTAYHDWACRNNARPFYACPPRDINARP